jgi:hypothetical protein
MQISLAVPPALKQQLVADHDTIKKEGKLLPLPRSPCVEEILASYAKSRQKRGGIDSEAQQVANGLRTYFDRCLALARFCSIAAHCVQPCRHLSASSRGTRCSIFLWWEFQLHFSIGCMRISGHVWNSVS